MRISSAKYVFSLHSNELTWTFEIGLHESLAASEGGQILSCLQVRHNFLLSCLQVRHNFLFAGATQLLAYLLEELPAVADKSQNKGILKTAVGYTGGNPLVTNPSYKLVCGGATDHAEAVKIEFDPSIVSYGELVGVWFSFPFLHSFDGVEQVNRVLLSKSRPNNGKPPGRRHGYS